MFVSTRSTLPWIRRILAMREGRYNILNMFVIPTFNEQRIAELEEHLQDLRLHSANKTGEAKKTVTRVEVKDEAYWRKQFAEIRYKIRTAQSELDILQRELNEGLLIYDPNPQKAMRENVTRKNINAHRQAIEDKKKEIAELQKQLSDLEDDLRHAGGDPGWSRE